MIHRLILLGVLAALLLAGCTLPSLRRERLLPTIGPVQDPPGKNTFLQIAATTNCTQVGETVTITAHIRNRERYPVTLVGTPPLDIVIQPALWPQDKPKPVRRWSESDQYPSSLDLALDPGEEHTYTWIWKAEAINAQEPHTWVLVDLIITALVDPNGSPNPVGSTKIAIGVNRMPLAGGGSVPCSELHR